MSTISETPQPQPQPQPPTSLMRAALDLAERGWPVFPTRPGDKQPIPANGLLEATTNEAQIVAWWAAHPGANIGARTGVLFDVLDLDSPEAEGALLTAGGPGAELPIGPTAATGKGRHIYVRPTGLGNRVGFLEHVDWRGRNGYVITPPSIHPNGKTYRWQWDRGPDLPLPPCPDWLLALVRGPRTEGSGSVRLSHVSNPSKYAAAALHTACERLTATPPGQRHNAVYREAAGMAELVVRGWLDGREATTRLLAATAGWPNQEKTISTIADAFRRVATEVQEGAR